MKCAKYTALLSALLLLLPLSVWARAKNQHSLKIRDSVQVGATQLKPGTYEVEWQEAGPVVHVEFVKNGKTMATASGTLKMNDAQVSEDDIVVQSTSDHRKVLKEIDFQRQKEALIFG